MKKVVFVAILLLVAAAVFVVWPYVLLPVSNGSVSCDGVPVNGARVYRNGAVIIAQLPNGELLGADLNLRHPIACDRTQYEPWLGVLVSPSDDPGLYCYSKGAIGCPLLRVDGVSRPRRANYLVRDKYATFPAACGEMRIDY
jgi:hypothetical protein